MFSTPKPAAYLGVGVKALQLGDRQDGLKPERRSTSVEFIPGRYWMVVMRNAARSVTKRPIGVGVCQAHYKDRI
jgi:hypothetical protein